MAAKTLRGVVPILITPFDEQGRIDVDSLQNLIDFNIAAGVAGLGVALGSEVFKFNEAERDLITKKVVDKVNGRVPVVINTGAHGTDLALQYSRSAEALGADALMVIPPHFVPVGPGEIARYYQTIDRGVGIPIILQDIPQAPVPPALLSGAMCSRRPSWYCTRSSVPARPAVPRSQAISMRSRKPG